MNKTKSKIKLNPIMTLVILIGLTIVLSGILSLFRVSVTYNEVNSVTNTYDKTLVSVENMFSLSGLKYIFSSTVSNFVAFTPLSMLIIILIGIGVMEKSGFLKTTFTLITKNAQKKTITFAIVLISILFSLAGDLGYVIMIPLSALVFLYGRRNPLIGIVASFAGLTCGTGLSVIFTSVDSSLMNITLNASHILDNNYTMGVWAYFLIMLVAAILVSILITFITERFMINEVEKYEFKEEKKEFKLTKRELRGLLFAGTVGLVYVLFFIYNIIPNVPFGGNLLDYKQALYIDKLFSPDSFFSQGFVFIITMLFVLLGLFYGLGAKTIKNNNDFCDDLGHSLDEIGKPIVLILLASVLINVFKKSNIGTVIVGALSNLVGGSAFTGIPLLILFFLVVVIATVVLPGSVNKWTILAGNCVPIMMNAGFSPEFIQVIFRFGECVTYGITPIMAYYVIYLAYLEKYQQGDEPITLFRSLKYQRMYSYMVGILLLVILILWYIVGLPLGSGAPTI